MPSVSPLALVIISGLLGSALFHMLPESIDALGAEAAAAPSIAKAC
jgi:hypothetical protein